MGTMTSEWTLAELRVWLLRQEQACEWAEKHLDADEYIAEFGTPEEGDAQIAVKIPAATKHLLDVECSKRGVTQAQVIGELLETLGK